ncbi:hypothetical protein [Archangium sp.]|uniref:hypothetical protein n=1 Tax=Archangium sp. TaxID=1872627 RepID=UPI002D5BBDEF|nr:hypothetical protein [Archangium sp.]HYO54680.1 hypothetical protein [Archangium sp.]
MSLPEWRHALSASPEHRLEAALFTTYEPADPAFLVEHLLPSLLNLSREPNEATASRALYFGELALELERLRGKLLVISSGAGEEDGGGTPLSRPPSRYPWLWRYVMPFTVDGVQHAKLWLLHWSHEEGEYLDIVISSTNLSESAFRDQIQAGWRAQVKLDPRRSDTRLRTWGPLVPFLQALGTAGGENAAERTAHFLELLARAECPEGVSFVASVPSAPGRERWGARLLGDLLPEGRGPLHVWVCAPYVGSWNTNSLAAWCKAVGARPDLLKLAWIDTGHPWAAGGSGEGVWRMPRSAHTALVESGASLSRLGHARDESFSAFHASHSQADPRWSHAKFYFLRRGRERRLLVTSANFSPSAWGQGERGPRNFELGVAFDAEWPLELLPFEPYEPHLTSEPERPAPAILLWAQATWDGRRVTLQARSTQATPVLTAAVHLGPGQEPLELGLEYQEDEAGRLQCRGVVRWSEPHPTPVLVRLSQGEAILEVPVLDLRPPEEFARTPLPEVDPKLSEEIRDALLLESYGGPTAEPGRWAGVREEGSGAFASGASPSDYTVPAFAQARAWFEVIDNWQKRWNAQAGHGDEQERTRLKLDGTRLAALFSRKAEQEVLEQRVPARLAAEELRWRLKEMSRES